MKESLAFLSDSIPFPALGKELPKELLLFTWGRNETTKGPLFLTEDGAKQAIARYQKHKAALCFDLWHSTFDPRVPPAWKKSAGYWRLGANSLGLCAQDVLFLPKIAKEVQEGEWPYYSPAALHKEDRRITGVRNIALTTLPATENARLLLASEGIFMNDQQITDLRNLIDAVETLMGIAQKVSTSDEEKLKALGQKAITYSTELMTGLQNLAQELDPTGETEGQSNLSQALDLVSYCQELTKKSSVPAMKGVLRAWDRKLQNVTTAHSDSKKKRLSELVEKGIEDRLIQHAEKEHFLTLSVEEIESFLEESKPVFQTLLSDIREAKPKQPVACSEVKGDEECQRLVAQLRGF